MAAGNADEGLGFLIVPLGDLLAFAVLVGLGRAWRPRTDLHRRHMLLASIPILPAAIGRISGMAELAPCAEWWVV